MLARALGKEYGVAKKGTPIIVRLYPFNFTSWIRAVLPVYERQRRKGKPIAVMTFSASFSRRDEHGKPLFQGPDGQDQWEKSLEKAHDALTYLREVNILPVVSSGNEGAVSSRTSYWPPKHTSK